MEKKKKRKKGNLQDQYLVQCSKLSDVFFAKVSQVRCVRTLQDQSAQSLIYCPQFKMAAFLNIWSPAEVLSLLLLFFPKDYTPV